MPQVGTADTGFVTMLLQFGKSLRFGKHLRSAAAGISLTGRYFPKRREARLISLKQGHSPGQETCLQHLPEEAQVFFEVYGGMHPKLLWSFCNPEHKMTPVVPSFDH